MEVEHIVAVVVAALISLVLLWVVWWFLCRSRDDDMDEEIGSPAKITNTHLITGGQQRLRGDSNLTDEDLSEDDSNSRYILRPEALSDPFGVWSPKETLHSNPRSSYKTIYPKSPNLQRASRKNDSGALYV